MKLLERLFPRQCILCGSLGNYLCTFCKRKLKPHPEICPYCHKYSHDYCRCLDCFSPNNLLQGVIIPFVYSGDVKRLVLKLKYFHKRDIANFLAERMSIALLANQSFQNCIQNKKVFVHGIPSHRFRKYFVKGYNQSEKLAKLLAQKSGFMYIQNAKKQKRTSSQAKLSRQKRLKNLHNAFQWDAGFHQMKNSVLLLVDDISTSGASLNEFSTTVNKFYPGIDMRAIVIGRRAG